MRLTLLKYCLAKACSPFAINTAFFIMFGAREDDLSIFIRQCGFIF